MTVMTVLGPVAADQLGAVLPHEHILANLYRVSGNPDHLLDDVELACAEVARLRAAGGSLLVDCTSGGLGRDPAALVEVARRTGVHIVMGCGWYRQSYYGPEIERATVESLAAEILADIETGVGDTGIRAGIIGEIGSDLDYIAPAEERVLRAAARAQLRSGLTLTTHAARSTVGMAQLDVLEEEGVDLRRVIVGHCDTSPDPEYHAALAARGAFVAFDTTRGLWRWDTDARVRWIRALQERGLLDHVLVSQDVCMKSHLHAYGGNGYDYVLTGFADELLAAGFTTTDLHTLTVDNPIAALTGSRCEGTPDE